MALALVGRGTQVTVPRFGGRQKESSGPSGGEAALSRQIDLLCYQSEQQRERILKTDWTSQIEKIYNMTDTWAPVPTFRPRVQIPELQFQMLAEASDLTDVSPLPFLVNTLTSERDRQRELALQAQWRSRNFNLHMFTATLWSLYAGNGYLRIHMDPDAKSGLGEVSCHSPHPGTVYPDPFAQSDEDMKYVVFEEYMWINEVRRRWPERGFDVHHHRPGAPSTLDTQLSLPAGPMSTISGMPTGHESSVGTMASDEARVRVRTCFVRDYSVEYLKDDFVAKKNKDGRILAFPHARPKYPGGRLIVECEGVILLDKPNPFPLGLFPVVTVHGMPPLTSFFAPPPIRYTLDIQKLAERFLTQVFENAVRVNNVITFVYDDSGIDIEEYGGIPGGVHMINSGSKKPEILQPEAFGQQQLELPLKLLELVKELNGFTPARKGMPGAGNLSTPLFDAAVLQSQSLTRMRSRFLAESFRRLAWIVFATMGTFYTQKRDFPSFRQDEDELKYEAVGWEPLVDNDPSVYELQIDANSIRPFSQVALRSIVPTLRQLGMIDAKTGREWLDLPDTGVIEQRMKAEAQAQMQAAALGIKPGKPGGKKK